MRSAIDIHFDLALIHTGVHIKDATGKVELHHTVHRVNLGAGDNLRSSGRAGGAKLDAVASSVSVNVMSGFVSP
jgi:hypothetical protein